MQNCSFLSLFLTGSQVFQDKFRPRGYLPRLFQVALSGHLKFMHNIGDNSEYYLQQIHEKVKFPQIHHELLLHIVICGQWAVFLEQFR